MGFGKLDKQADFANPSFSLHACGDIMILFDFLGFMLARRRIYTGVILGLCVIGIFLEGAMTWRAWAMIICFTVYMAVEFTTWFLDKDEDGELDDI